MEVAFNAEQQPVEAAVETKAEIVNPAPAPVETPTAPMSVPATTQAMPVGPSGMVLGDKIPDFKDIVLPRINLVQNIGELKNSFEPGSLVYGQSTVLYVPPKIDGKTQKVIREGTPPAILTVLGFRPTRYCEKVPGGGKGMIVDSEDAVRANGGTLDYREWKLKRSSGMKRFDTLADALIAVERPASIVDDDSVFNYEVDGKKYALALWAMRGTVYTALAKKVLFTGRAIGVLRKGYPTRSFALSSREEPFDTEEGKVASWVPIAIPHEVSTPAFMEFVRSIIG